MKTKDDIRYMKEQLGELWREVRVLRTIVHQIMKNGGLFQFLPFEMRPFYISKADGKRLGDLMTIAEFENAVRSGMFIDYDGHGYFANEHLESNIRVTPSIYFDLVQYIDTKVLTHVIWFNR